MTDVAGEMTQPEQTTTTTRDETLARFREYMVGPSRFMTLLSSCELGLVSTLRERPGMTAVELADAVGADPEAVEQLLQLLVKEGFVAFDPSADAFSLDALAAVPEADLRRALTYMNMIKVVALRQLFYLTESARSGQPVGLKELYGHEGTLYDAVEEHHDLREAWATLMDNVTAKIDPWFFGNIEIPVGARVLDLAGNTGLGAIHTYEHQASPGLQVTTFDLPEKEAECLENFRSHGVAEHCSFIGGNVFEEVPKGFDVVLIKHFLDMFGKADVLRILTTVNESLEAGGQVNILVPVYPEDITEPENYNVDFFPAFFIGCTMGQGGPQKVSTYETWLRECGFEVTKVITKDSTESPPDVIPVQAVISAVKRHDVGSADRA